MANGNTEDRLQPVLMDSAGRPIYGQLAGDAPETIVRLVTFWRSKGIGVCTLKACARFPLTIEAINYSAMRAASYDGGRREWEQGAERRSVAASKPRKSAAKAAIRAEVDRVQASRKRRRPFTEEELLNKIPELTKKRLRAAFGKAY